MTNISYNDENLIPTDEFRDSVRVGRGDFRNTGDRFIERYIDNGWISQDSVFLDIGCGLGRMARPLVNYIKGAGKYIGFDINKTSIDWCNKSYKDLEEFSFGWLDIASKVYNPDGKSEASSLVFPLDDESVDFVHMSSVFTHMWPKDIHSRT